jgi:TetR/AcrR family transcriptional repressor of nem operon
MARTAPKTRKEQKLLTRERIVEAVGRGFRRSGFGGAGVDGLAKEAGVTSGAFYVHFESKAAAFREAVRSGMSDLKQGLSIHQQRHSQDWWREFVHFYLHVKRKCDLTESCALQSLAPEVARSDAGAREVFETELREAAAIILAGPRSAGAPADESAALVALSTLLGAVTLARAVSDAKMAEQIANGAEKLLAPSAASCTTRKSRAR